jgi:hypothetical protein
MNRNIKPILIVMLLLLVSTSFSQRRDSQPVKFKKISNNLYEILGGRGTQMGAYIGDKGKSVVEVRRRNAQMLDFRRISVSWGLSGKRIGHVGDQTP